MRRRVLDYDVHTWASAFMLQLQPEQTAAVEGQIARPQPALRSAIAEARKTMAIRLLLDYDGTLVRLVRSPELAAPDAELLALLQALATTSGIELELVSERPRETLDVWFGHLPITLWAEHGFWQRQAGGQHWQQAANVPPGWMDRIYPILEQFTASTPGSHIEIKTVSVAWHYRGAHPEFGARQAHELRMLLGDALSNQPLEVLEGKKVIEVRVHGITKAVVAQTPTVTGAAPALAVAFGDDRTDEDLFRALPPSSLTVAVGQHLSGAGYQLEDYRAVRELLRSLLDRRRGWGTKD
jgi:trehalose 6-phosphate synthase/phosphatase